MAVQMIIIIIQLQAISSEAGEGKKQRTKWWWPHSMALDEMESDGLHELLEFMYILRVS